LFKTRLTDIRHNYENKVLPTPKLYVSLADLVSIGNFVVDVFKSTLVLYSKKSFCVKILFFM